MKVIDLLNKIANNDLDTPDYIEFFDREKSKSNKIMVCEENIIYYMNRNALFLNDEVEIIEEKHKIPEKFEIYDNSIEWCYNGRSISDNVKDIMDKINEILDYLEEINE